jgi:hypothetical protein
VELNGNASVVPSPNNKFQHSENSCFKILANELDGNHLFFLKETVHCLSNISSMDGIVIRVIAVIALFYQT